MKNYLKILAFIIIISLLPVSAAAEYVTVDHITGGSFEDSDGTTAPGWAISGSSIAITKEQVHSGTYALKMEGLAWDKIGQRVRNLVGGQKYTLSFWMRSENGGKALYSKYEIVNDAGEYLTGDAVGYITHEISSYNIWRKIVWEFTAPDRADQGYFYIILKENSKIYIDDISMTGPVDTAQDCVLEDVPEGADNLINSDFTVTNNGARLWEAYLGWDNGYVSLAEDTEKGTVAKIATNLPDKNPWVRYLFPVTPTAVYQITCDIKTNNVSGVGPRFKAEYYTINQANGRYSAGEGQSPIFNQTFGTWQKVGSKLSPPKGALYMAIYIRLYGTGELYVSNVEAYKLSDPPRMYFGSSAFNYTDVGYGLAYARANKVAYSLIANSKIRFETLDGELIISTYETAAKDEVIYKFKIGEFTEDKYYTMRISYLNSDNTVIETSESKVCRTARPAKITTDGFFIGYNNEKIIPKMGYHILSSDDFDECAAAGINVVQFNPGGNASVLTNALNKAQEAGIYLAVVLYDNGRAAGSPRNIARTTSIVNSCKNHPALFAWMVQDEPLWNDPYCYPVLFDSYELIHSLDRNNPVYMCEGSEEMCIDIGGVCDVLGIDPYPSSLGVKRVGDVTRNVSKGTKGIKPLINILQCFAQTEFKPTVANVRQMAYQGFFMGATGVGYYPVNEPGTAILWQEDCYRGVTSINQNEIEDAVKAFVTGEYPTFSQKCGIGDSVWYKLYVKNNELYLIAINREKTESQFSVPLISGSVTIGDFSATAVDISGAADVIGNKIFTTSLSSYSTVKYKITPVEQVDYEDISKDPKIYVNDFGWNKITGTALLSETVKRNGNESLCLTGDSSGNASVYAEVTATEKYMIAEAWYKIDGTLCGSEAIEMGYSKSLIVDDSTITKVNSVKPSQSTGTWYRIRIGFMPSGADRITLAIKNTSAKVYFSDIIIYGTHNIAEYATNGNHDFETYDGNGINGYTTNTTIGISSFIDTERKAEGNTSLKIKAGTIDGNSLLGVGFTISLAEMDLLGKDIKLSYKVSANRGWALSVQSKGENFTDDNSALVDFCENSASSGWTECTHYMKCSSLNKSGALRIRAFSDSRFIENTDIMWLDDIKIEVLEEYGEASLLCYDSGRSRYNCTDITSGGQIQPHIYLINDTGSILSAKVLVSEYKIYGNSLKLVNLNCYSVSAGNRVLSQNVGNVMENTGGDDKKVKIIILKDFSKVYPLTKAKAATINGG